MTTMHDIHCPSCDEAASVHKEGIDTYRCRDCEQTFSIGDLVDG